MNTTDGKVGILREQGEFFDHHPLSEEDAKIFEEQQKKNKENTTPVTE